MSGAQTNGTASTSTTEVSLDKMLRAMREIELLAPLPWVLISPDGRMWKGSQRDVARVLFQNIDIASLFTDSPQAASGRQE